MRSLALHQPPAVELRRRDAGQVAVVEVRGVADLFTAPALHASLRSAADEGRAVLVDLSGVEYMDSSGVVALVRVQRALAGGRRLAVACPPGGPVARLLERICAERIFDVYQRVDDALSAVG